MGARIQTPGMGRRKDGSPDGWAAAAMQLCTLSVLYFVSELANFLTFVASSFNPSLAAIDSASCV